MHTPSPKQELVTNVFSKVILVQCPRCNTVIRGENYIDHVFECAESSDSRFGHKAEN
jgi:hypothetical protein